MIDSYESVVIIAEHGIESLRERVRRVAESWDRHEAELRRLHPELVEDDRRGPVVTPWQIAKQ